MFKELEWEDYDEFSISISSGVFTKVRQSIINGGWISEGILCFIGVWPTREKAKAACQEEHNKQVAKMLDLEWFKEQIIDLKFGAPGYGDNWAEVK